MKIKDMPFLGVCVICLNLYFNISGNAQGTNPLIWADVPDPSVIRVDSIYYMSSTTMHMNPGLPIMKSMDLVNWEMASYAYDILIDNNAMKLSSGQEAYGDGSWASSLRYHDSTFYVVTFSYTTGKTHIYQTDNIEEGNWTAYTLNSVYHDPGLLFDDDRVYLVYGINDIKIIELNPDVTGVKSGGLNKVLIPNAKGIAGSGDFYVPAEGSHIYKINGKYYVFLISWPAGSMRTELVYRADSLTGSFEGKIALRDDGVAQGGLIETYDGTWYGFLFQDHGSVGRIPYLVPVTWEDDWPLFGVNGQVPGQLNIPVKNDSIPAIVASDEFDWVSDLPLVWQWNHNPDNDNWSATDRQGYLRIKNGRVDTGFLDTQNTLTQRTFGPQCSGRIAVDISQMKNGDVAGFGVLQKNYGFVAVQMSEGSKTVIMVNASSGSAQEIESIPLTQDSIYLQISCNFTNKTDKAYFYYSLDGMNWKAIGNRLQMSYTLPHFMGYRFALFNYATKETGGYVDFNYFRIHNDLTWPTAIKGASKGKPSEFRIFENYPNPFNPQTTITYQLAKTVNVKLTIYNIAGEEIQTLVDKPQSTGQYSVSFNAAGFASGLYIYTLKAGNEFMQSRKLMVLK